MLWLVVPLVSCSLLSDPKPTDTLHELYAHESLEASSTDFEPGWSQYPSPFLPYAQERKALLDFRRQTARLWLEKGGWGVLHNLPEDLGWAEGREAKCVKYGKEKIMTVMLRHPGTNELQTISGLTKHQFQPII